ncbi:MAG: hypothetical protein CL681_26380, partial [Blastopirellula sp.]|nr:hypothetical protein [Blastopirellula sp.]
MQFLRFVQRVLRAAQPWTISLAAHIVLLVIIQWLLLPSFDQQPFEVTIQLVEQPDGPRDTVAFEVPQSDALRLAHTDSTPTVWANNPFIAPLQIELPEAGETTASQPNVYSDKGAAHTAGSSADGDTRTAATQRHQQVQRPAYVYRRFRHFTDDGMARLKTIERLHTVSFYLPHISNEGLSHLKTLPHLRHIQIFHSPRISRHTITDAGMKHLRGLPHLEGIQLTNARITDAGLGQLKGLRNLRYMGLEGTRITDAGLEHLQDLRHLKTLSLGNTRVTDDGLKHLHTLQQLQELGLDDTRITSAGLAHLNGL